MPPGPGALFAKAHGRSPCVMGERMESKEHARTDGSTCLSVSDQSDNKVLFTVCALVWIKRKRSLLAVQT